MSKRYQVFVSSTYADLKEERSKVIQTIMELDCIPAGMELFPSIDEEQYNFIKRIIDDCDYYILIIGGRYGSLSEDGISYTEKEYDYAIEKGIKVMAFIHGNPDEIAYGKSEQNEDARKKLDAFKTKVSTGRLVKFWNKPEELPGLVALSLPKTIKTYPATGWVRANAATPSEILQELNEQRKENDELKEQVKSLTQNVEDKPILNIENLAGLDDSVVITGTYYNYSDGTKNWKHTLTWKELFYILSPELLDIPSDIIAFERLSQAVFLKTGLSAYIGKSTVIDNDVYQTIKIHLKLLGLIDIRYTETTKGGMALFLSLTKKGEETMMRLRAVKKD